MSSASSPEAVKEGIQLLQKYISSAKKSSRSSTPATGSDHYYDAVAHGSALRLAFSDSKKKTRRESIDKDNEDDNDDIQEASPLELIQFSLLKLDNFNRTEILDDQHTIPSVIAMLRGVEEFLENNNAIITKSKLRSRLSYDDDGDSEPCTPVKRSFLDHENIANISHSRIESVNMTTEKSDQKKLKSVYMENQLDLHESELEYYERMMYEMADSIEMMGKEKLDLNAIIDDLKERISHNEEKQKSDLQKTIEDFEDQKLFLISKFDDNNNQLNQIKQLFTDEKSINEALTSEVTVLREQLTDDEKKMLALKEERNILNIKIDQISNSMNKLEEENMTQINMYIKDISDLKREITNLETVNNNKSAELNTLRENIDILKHLETENSKMLEDMKVENSQLKLLMDNVNTNNDNNNNQHADDHDNYNTIINNLKAEIEDFQSENDNLSSKLEEYRSQLSYGATIANEDNDQTANADLLNKINELNQQVASKTTTIESLESKQFDLTEQLSKLTSRLELTDSNNNISTFFSPNNKSKSSTSVTKSHLKHYNSVIKVYMDNQLDLNESETEQYENMINDLATKVEELTEEKNIIQLEYESVSLQLTEKEAIISKLNEELVSERLGNDTSRIAINDNNPNSFFSPNKSSLNISRSHNNNNNSVLKVYMDNQLDLNESEMEYYENVINDLASKIDFLTEEKNELQLIQDDLNNKLIEKVEIINRLTIELMNSSNSRSPVAVEKTKLISESFLGVDSRTNSASPDNSNNNIKDSEEDNDSIDFLIPSNPHQGPQSTPVPNLDDIARRYNQGLNSFHSTNEPLYNNNNKEDLGVEELKYVITRREQQVKAQTSQLEYLQLSLSEQKTANKLLKQQKSSLKAVVEEFKAKEMTYSTTIQELSLKIEMFDDLLGEKESKIQALSNDLTELSNNQLDINLFGEASENDHEVRMQMLLLNRSKEDHQLENEKLLIRIESKTKQVEELNNNLISLRDEIDKKQVEIDSLKLKEIKFDTSYRLKEIDNEKDIEILKNTIQSLENNYNIAIDNLRVKEEELVSEKDVNTSLRQLLLKLGEKDDVSEDLLSEFKIEKSELYRKLQICEKELVEKDDFISSLERNYSQLENDYQSSIEEKANSEMNFNVVIQELRVELGNWTNKYNMIRNDKTEYVEDVEKKFATLLDEKAFMEIQLKESSEKCRAIENNLRDNEINISFKLTELSSTKTVLNNIVENILNFNNSMIQQEKRLCSNLSDKINFQQNMISDLQNQLSTLSNSIDSKNNEILLKYNESLVSFKLVNAEKEELANKLLITCDELDSAKMSSAIPLLLLDKEQSVVNPSEDYTESLLKKIEEYKNREISISENNAALFANYTNNISYLEGENNRLKTLMDHYKLVNIKLCDDLKVNNMENVNNKIIENKLKTLLKENSQLKEKVSMTEKNLHKKERELLESIKSITSLENTNSDFNETEVRDLSNKIKALESSNNRLTKENNELKEYYEERDRSYQIEFNSLKDQHSSMEHLYGDLKIKFNTAENSLNSVKSILKDTESKVEQSNVTISILNHEIMMTKESNTSIISNLNSEIEEKQKKLIYLESNVDKLKSNIYALENSYLTKDEEYNNKLLDKLSTEEENRKLRNMLDLNKTELYSCKANSEVMQDNIGKLNKELNIYMEKYNFLNDNTLVQLKNNLLQAESKISSLTDDLLQREEVIASRDNIIAITKNNLLNAEKSVQSLEVELEALQEENRSLSSSNHNFSIENQRFKNLIEELQKDAVHLVSTISEQKIRLTQLELTQNDNESKLSSYDSRIEFYNKFEVDLINETAEFIDLMASNFKHFNNSEDSTNESKLVVATPFSKRGIDLFNSPPLTTALTPVSSNNYNNRNPLSSLKENFDVIKVKYESLLNNNIQYYDQLERLKKEKEELLKTNDHNSSKLRLVIIENENQINKIDLYDKEINILRNNLNLVDNEKNNLLKTRDLFGQKLLNSIRTLDTKLLESYAKSNDSIAGIIPINNNKLPDLSQTMITKGDIDTNMDIVNVFIEKINNCTEFFQNVINAVVTENSKTRNNYEKLELMCQSKETYYTKELTSFAAKNSSLEEELLSCESSKSEIVGKLEEAKSDIVSLKQFIENISSNNLELEKEFKETIEINNNLNSNLSEMNIIIGDLKEKNKYLTADNNLKVSEIQLVKSNLEVYKNRLIEYELLTEKNTFQINRIKAEKDAIDNVRKSLEIELERLNSDINLIKDSAKDVDENERATFELEKLLTALETTIDQFLPSLSSSNALVIKDSVNKSSPSLSDRVDEMVKKLSKVRSSHREESRKLKNLEEMNNSLTSELSDLQAAVDNMNKHSGVIRLSLADKERESKEKARDLNETSNELSKIKMEHNSLKTTHDLLNGQFDDLKKAHQQDLYALQMKESDLVRLNRELEKKDFNLIKIKEDISTVNFNNNNLTKEVESLKDQLKQNKLHNEKLIDTINKVEIAKDEDHKERDMITNKLVEFELSSGKIIKLKNRVNELETNLNKVTDDLKDALSHKVLLEDSNSLYRKDIDNYKKKVSTLEGRINQILEEKNSFVDEIAQTHKQIQLAKENAERLKNERYKSTDTISKIALIESGNVSKQLKESEIELLTLQAEEEKKSLKSIINELKVSCHEKEEKLAAENNDRRKLEKDLKQMKKTLEKRNSELNNSTSYSTMVRTEGRLAKKVVYNSISLLEDFLNLIKIDAKNNNIDISFNEPAKPLGSGNDTSYEESLALGLIEALGINDLTTCIDSFRPVINWIRVYFKNKMELEMANQKLISDNETLKKELSICESKRTDFVQQYKDEINVMESHINELRNNNNKNPHLLHQINVLENLLDNEKSKKEKALHDLELLKSRVDNLTQDMALSSTSRLIKASSWDDDNLKIKSEKYQADMKKLETELIAVNHHRTILIDTVEQLDNKVQKFCKLLIDNNISTDIKMLNDYNINTSMSFSIGDELDVDSMKSQMMRYKNRLIAMEEINNLYRTSVLALYSDGASYGAAQFGWQPHEEIFGNFGIGVGWIEREINAVRHIYENEIRSYDSELEEIRAKLRQSMSYSTELRRRYEDSVKTVYKSGRVSQISDDILSQNERLRNELEGLQKELFSTQQEQVKLKYNNKMKFNVLIDDIVKALQVRDAALVSLNKLENFCALNHLDISKIASFSKLRSEINNISSSLSERYNLQQQQQQPAVVHHSDENQKIINNLMRGLVETDHELVEAERRASRHKNRSGTEVSFSRSISNNSKLKSSSPDINNNNNNNKDYITKSNTLNNSRNLLDMEDNNNVLNSSRNLSNSFFAATKNNNNDVNKSAAKSTTTTSSLGIGKLRISKATKGYLNK